MRLLQFRKIIILLFAISAAYSAFAQQTVIVAGEITDAQTGEALPMANVVALPKSLNIWVAADMDGRYSIKYPANATGIEFSVLGYETSTITVSAGKIVKSLNIKLKPKVNQLNEVLINAEKVRYSNKNNPAVDLIRKVIANKNRNRIEARSYYEYTKYEKIELALNNLSDSVRQSTAFRKFKFLNNYIDTSASGTLSLPVFFRENVTECYFRKDPTAMKEYLVASKMSDFNDFLETATLGTFIDGLAGRTNLYDNTVMILDNEYQGPLSSLAPNFYKYHIIDTVLVSGVPCINLSMYPRNDADFGFAGNLYITNDSLYALKRAELRFTKNAAINFVRDFSLVQEYTMIDSTWALTLDEVLLDFGVNEKKSLMVGHRTNSYHGYLFDKKVADMTFKGVTQEKLPGYDMRGADYWESARPLPLTVSEQGVYSMVEDIKQDKAFNRIMKVAGMLFSGYANIGVFDIGPLESFFSFNEVEGARLRVGGKTNARLSPHLFFDGFVAYGTKDERFKYHAGLIYSFNKRKLHPWEYPKNMLGISYEYNTETPGQAFLFGSADRLFLSFHRGKAQKMVYHRKFEVNYEKEFINGFSIRPSFVHLEEEPAGGLRFENAGGTIDNIVTSQANILLRYASQERFYQTQQNRFPLNHTSPVFTLSYTYGINKFWESDYDFHRLELGIDKRTWFSSIGFLDLWLKAGKIWNTVPFPLLIIHQANQNYAYQDEAFNMMNYMEFVSDQYASASISYCFNGWIFNRLPLIKKLKWREYVTFKSLWGSVADHNDPLKNPDNLKLFYFPSDENGNPTTFALGGKPFMEASFGIDNIFKVLRLDLIRRINYLDHPDIPEWSVRFRVRFVF